MRKAVGDGSWFRLREIHLPTGIHTSLEYINHQVMVTRMTLHDPPTWARHSATRSLPVIRYRVDLNELFG